MTTTLTQRDTTPPSLLATMERRLERGPIWLDTLLEQLPVGVLITDPAGRVVRANTTARSLHGSCYWPRFSGISGEDDAHRVRPLATPIERLEWELARALLMNEAVQDERLELLGSDGTRRWLSVSVSVVRDDDGEIAAGVVTLQDVTARTRLDRLMPALETLARL